MASPRKHQHRLSKLIDHLQQNETSVAQHIQEYDAKLVVDCKNILGECPIWDYRRELVCWIDIEGATFWTYNPLTKQSKSYSLPERPGCFALCDPTYFAADTYLFAFETGPQFYNISSARCIGDKIFDFEPNKSTITNDGRVDRKGRLVFGGKDGELDFANPLRESGVYRVNTDLSHERLLDLNVGCVNSICWSKDGSTMYFTDILGEHDKQTIFKYNYYCGAKRPDHREVFGVYDKSNKRFKLREDENCFVDGSTVDSEDAVWNAGCGSGRVWRWNKRGMVDMIVHVAEPFVTCACFGGTNLDTLYITTLNLSGKEKGGLYAVTLPIKGCKENIFLGH